MLTGDNVLKSKVTAEEVGTDSSYDNQGLIIQTHDSSETSEKHD